MLAPFDVAGRELFVTSSIGIAVGSIGDKPDDLLREADQAMYWTKERDKACHEVSRPCNPG